MYNSVERLLNHIDQLDSALQSDGECGSHHLNNRKSDEFAREHPALIRWLNDLRDIRDTIINQ